VLVALKLDRSGVNLDAKEYSPRVHPSATQIIQTKFHIKNKNKKENRHEMGSWGMEKEIKRKRKPGEAIVLSELTLIAHKVRDGEFWLAPLASPAIRNGEDRFVEEVPILAQEGLLGLPVARLEDVLSVHLSATGSP
jgi:hypothetical protein